MEPPIKRSKSDKSNEPSLNQKSLSDLRKSNTFCDALIVLEDGGCIPVHRVILCTASGYFYNLFMSSPIDKPFDRPGYLVKCVTTATMECIVEFVYAENCDVNETNLTELLSLAERFCLNSLTDRCLKFLQSSLNWTLTNCISLMSTAKFISRRDIQTNIHVYILSNFIEIAATNEDLLTLSCEDIINIIRDDALNTKTEEPVWEFCQRWIEYDEMNRLQSVPLLLSGIRLGLLTQKYFEERVLHNKYVRLNPEATTIIEQAYKLVSDSNEMEELNESDISLLVPRLPQEILFVIGGWKAGSATTLFQTFDIRADRWSEYDEFNIPDGPRSYHGAAVVGNKIYCIGGFNTYEFNNKCSVFDVVAKTWTEIGPMHCKRCYVSVCVLDGKIYAIGGNSGDDRHRSTELYCPKTNQWTLLADMTDKRSDADAVQIGGKIYILGGYDGSKSLRSCEVYDVAENKWTYIPDMLSQRSGLKCVVYRNQIYAIGGWNGVSRVAYV
ncbi:hypothetical protein HA402_001867 [Bradysia odoriphaga]|nr:hypothetical protein HA402_001867 [Bradysia odoriphaga]